MSLLFGFITHIFGILQSIYTKQNWDHENSSYDFLRVLFGLERGYWARKVGESAPEWKAEAQKKTKQIIPKDYSKSKLNIGKPQTIANYHVNTPLQTKCI